MRERIKGVHWSGDVLKGFIGGGSIVGVCWAGIALGVVLGGQQINRGHWRVY